MRWFCKHRYPAKVQNKAFISQKGVGNNPKAIAILVYNIVSTKVQTFFRIA